MADRVVRQLSADEMRFLQRGTGDRVVRQLSPDEFRVISSSQQPVSPQIQQPDAMDFSIPDYRSEFKPEDLGMLNALWRGGLSGVTFGFSDELLPDTERQRRYMEALKQENPWTYFVGEVLGAALPAMATGGIGLVGRAAASGAGWALRAQQIASKIKHADKIGQAMLRVGDRPIIGGILGMTGTGTPTIGTLARAGALSGAAHGLGSAEGGIGERLKGAAQNAAIAGIMAPALGGAVMVGTKGAGWLGRKVLPRSAESEVGDILARTSEPDIVAKLRELEKDATKNVFEIKPEMARSAAKAAETNAEVYEILSKEFASLHEDIGKKVDDLVVDQTTNIVNLPESVAHIRDTATLVSKDMYDRALLKPFELSAEVYAKMDHLLDSTTVREQFAKALKDLTDVPRSRPVLDPSGYDVKPLVDSQYKNIKYQLSKPLLDELYKNLGELSEQAFAKGQKSTGATVAGLRDHLRGILEEHVEGYADAVTTHRANLLPADFLEAGYNAFSGKPSDYVTFTLKTLLKNNEDILTPELTKHVLNRFREGFSTALREHLQGTPARKVPDKMMELLSTSDFKKKFTMLFGENAADGMEKLKALQDDVAKELTKSKFFTVREYQGMPELNLREAFEVPTSNYQLVASLIQTASELLSPATTTMKRQKAIIDAMLLQSGKTREETARKIRKTTQAGFRRKELGNILSTSAVPFSARYLPNMMTYTPPEQR